MSTRGESAAVGERTAAEAALHDWFAGRADDPRQAQLAPLQRDAFARFSAAGLPHRRVEAYKYSDLRARLRTLPPPAAPLSAREAAAAAVAVAPLAGEEALQVVLVNGELATRPEGGVSGADGLVVEPLLAGAGADRNAVGSLVGDSADPLALLNTGLFDGGVMISAAAGAKLARPIEIVHVVSGDAPVTVMPRVFVEIGAGAEARIVERFVGGPDGSVSNALNEVQLGADARLGWVKLQGGESADSHFGSTFISLAEGADLSHFTGSTGAGYSRSQVFCKVLGSGASARFSASAIATGGRHVDHTLVVDHQAEASESRQLFRSAAGTGGEAIVQGRIFIARAAQKTDAQMMSNGLFLDDAGEIVNKPELEIFADDVQGAHGATTGGLDKEMLFYLRSRGVPRAEAERLLVEAFLLAAAAELPDETLRGTAETALVEALAAAYEGGRA